MPSSNENEYSKNRVSGMGCSYTPFGAYNMNTTGRNLVVNPRPASLRNPSIVVVPSFGGVSYNNLTTNMGTQKAPMCGGYLSMQDSYPQYPNNCGAFSSNLCG